MSHPLDDSWAKIERADEHIRSLNVEIADWLQAMEAKGQVASVRFEYDPKSGWIEGFINQIPETPPYRFGVIVGDIVHNLRSALDHLTWELANLHSPERGEDHATQFPIALSPEEFANQQRMVRHLSPDHVRLIEQEQPYIVSPQSVEDHPMAWLVDLSNRDKHQGVHPVSVSIGEYYAASVDAIRDCSITDRTTYMRDLKPNAKIMRMRLVPTGPNPQVGMNPSPFPPTVSVRKGNTMGRIHLVSRNLSAHVLRVIDRFAPLVDGRQPPFGG